MRPRRPLKTPSPDDLAKAALHYLARYAASEGALRKTLVNRLRRAAMRDDAFAADRETQTRLRAAIEDIIVKHKKSGVLNDAVFAEAKVATMRRAGKSAYAIRQKLGLKGVASSTIARALTDNAEGADSAEAERKAALAMTKRRKLGPFRANPASPERRQKDLAILARAGFPLDIARETLGSGRDEDF